MALGGQPGWRVAAVVAVALVHSCGQLAILRWTTTAQNIEHVVVMANSTVLVMLAALVVLSGGLASPLVLCLPVMTLPSALMLGLGRTTRATALAIAAYLILLIGAPPSLTGPPLPAMHHEVLTVLASLWAMTSVFIFTGRVSEATRAASDALGQLREERLSLALGQVRRLQSVGAKVAHELKNPLAAVKGLVQLVARAPDGDRSRERLDVVLGEISRMEVILQEYLSFARPLEDLMPQQVDLADVAEDVAAVLAGRAEQAKVVLAVAGPPVRLRGDPRRLKEALLNLVANAIEFTPPGGRVEIEVAPDAAGGGRMAVRDTGRGIAPDDLARVGTSFFTTRDTGTGLGVVLAKNVVAQHGGSFQLNSTPGHGTTVTIQLPSAPPSMAAAGTAARAPDTSPGAQHGPAPARR
jgi:signal transduction histidine kinase